MRDRGSAQPGEYRLHDSADILNEAEIRAVLTSGCRDGNVKFLKRSIPPTMKCAAWRSRARRRVLWWWQRSDGRKGQKRDADGDSPKGSGIWHSFLLRPGLRRNVASMLTLLAAMAVRKSVSDVTGLECLIKWPNDIVVNGKNLWDLNRDEHGGGIPSVMWVVGIGINANTRTFRRKSALRLPPWPLESGHPVHRAALINGVMYCL